MNATAARWLNKVPEVTRSFWVIKIVSTPVGETGADDLAPRQSRIARARGCSWRLATRWNSGGCVSACGLRNNAGGRVFFRLDIARKN